MVSIWESENGRVALAWPSTENGCTAQVPRLASLPKLLAQRRRRLETPAKAGTDGRNPIRTACTPWRTGKPLFVGLGGIIGFLRCRISSTWAYGWLVFLLEGLPSLWFCWEAKRKATIWDSSGYGETHRHPWGYGRVFSGFAKLTLSVHGLGGTGW